MATTGMTEPVQSVVRGDRPADPDGRPAREDVQPREAFLEQSRGLGYAGAHFPSSDIFRVAAVYCHAGTFIGSMGGSLPSEVAAAQAEPFIQSVRRVARRLSGQESSEGGR